MTSWFQLHTVVCSDVIVKNRSFQRQEIIHSHLICFLTISAINIALNILVTARNSFTWNVTSLWLPWLCERFAVKNITPPTLQECFEACYFPLINFRHLDTPNNIQALLKNRKDSPSTKGNLFSQIRVEEWAKQ